MAAATATGLDPTIPRTVVIVPAFEDGKYQEVRLESVCVAGGAGGAATTEVIR